MKLALLADVHANLPALEACLAHAQQQGATRIALLGDLIGYGPHPHPHEVIGRCRALPWGSDLVLTDSAGDLAFPIEKAWEFDSTKLSTKLLSFALYSQFLDSFPECFNHRAVRGDAFVGGWQRK